MAYLSVRPRFPKFVQSALVLFGAAVLGGLASGVALANPTSNSPLADGVYLYTQPATEAQFGSTYMVFEVSGLRTVGACYMANSSFDCFHGDISSTRLNLTVVDSYEQTSHPYSLAVQAESTLAAGQAGSGFNIVGFTPVDTLSQLDQHVLTTWQSDQGVI